MENSKNILSYKTIEAALVAATQALQGAGNTTAALDATVLLAHSLGTNREYVLMNPDRLLDNNDLSGFLALLQRRMHHEPIAYIIGKKEFWSLDFYVSRGTLIPRPDSETLIEAALKEAQHFAEEKRAKPITLLDIGTGTGCLLITLLKELPASEGVGVDNSKSALEVAKKNARQHNVEKRAQFCFSHFGEALDRTFDLIVSNPPYITEAAMQSLMPDVHEFEPHAALVAGKDGLDAYRAIASDLPRLLAANGVVVFEVGQGQATDVAQLAEEQGLTVTRVTKDLSGIERCVVARKVQ